MPWHFKLCLGRPSVLQPFEGLSQGAQMLSSLFFLGW
jgi:hypothetical protein